MSSTIIIIPTSSLTQEWPNFAQRFVSILSIVIIYNPHLNATMIYLAANLIYCYTCFTLNHKSCIILTIHMYTISVPKLSL